MAAQAAKVICLGTAQRELTGELRCVARQPILDLQGRVHGYDLIFRNTPDSVFRRDAGLAVETMLDNQVIFGLERLTNGLPAFITCTAEALIEGWVLVLSPGLTVLGVPANLDPAPELIEACVALRARGFRLALDDFSQWDKQHPLLDCADFIRLDFRGFREADLQQLQEHELGSVALVAQKVETQYDYQRACKMGFTLFQGDYLCQPVLLKKRKVPASRLAHFEIVRELYHDPIDIHKVSELVRRDASLTYRLLRLVNSPIYGIYREVRSVESAITVLGEATFRRIVSLAVLSELNTDQPAEILHVALIRARFCELAASHFSLDASEQYLLGMLSLLPAMLGFPMEEIVPILPLRGQVCEALAGTRNSERKLLGWLEFHERGDWASCDRIVATHGLNSSELVQCYLEAVTWAAGPSTA
ncbi:MAG TPA: HDOD domain-containing protein [Terracidiphilus sp.]|nr:HDOD domain-containing protein [Terracidiphilus sp.]